MSKEIPYEFLCSISRELMTDPVKIESGKTYDRANIQAWFKIKATDPLTNMPINNTTILKADDELWCKIIDRYGDIYIKQVREKRQSWKEQQLKRERIKFLSYLNDNADATIAHQFNIPKELVTILKKKKGANDYFKIIDVIQYCKIVNPTNNRNLESLAYDHMINFFNLFHNKKKLLSFLEFIASPEDFNTFYESLRKLTPILKNRSTCLSANNLFKIPKPILLSLIKHIKNNAQKVVIEKLNDELKLTIGDLTSWPSDNEGVLLFEALLKYSLNIQDLIASGVTIDDLKGLKEYSPEFRQQLLDRENGDWEYFDLLVLNEYAGIPWHKWVKLWEKDKEEKKDNTEDTISFNEILENEKLQEFNLRFGRLLQGCGQHGLEIQLT